MLASSTAADGTPSRDAILGVRDLRKVYDAKRGLVGRKVGEVVAVDGVSFEVKAGATLGLVGESGCGKSTTSRMIARLIEPTSGTVTFEGHDVTRASELEMRALRRRMQIILQDPFAFLNPQLTASANVREALRIQGIPRGQWPDRVAAALAQVGLKPGVANRMPSELSGGERQRVGIARAIVLEPSLLVLDEAVSALDVSVRAQVINLLKRLQQDLKLTYVFVSHDLAVVRSICSDVAVMYLGRIIEIGRRDEIFGNARHPYTQTLLSSVPSPDPGRRNRPRIPIVGEPPSATRLPVGCRFHPRCWKAQAICTESDPLLNPVGGTAHAAACHFPQAMQDALAEVARAPVVRKVIPSIADVRP
jgi:oligopeptide/dipeptide ABC transporter ATP-binding protein